MPDLTKFCHWDSKKKDYRGILQGERRSTHPEKAYNGFLVRKWMLCFNLELVHKLCQPYYFIGCSMFTPSPHTQTLNNITCIQEVIQVY